MEYSIRPAVYADIPRINELFIEMLRAIFGKDDAEGYAEGDLDYYFAPGDDIIFLAEHAGQVVAFLSVEGHHDHGIFYVYLDDFSVAEAYRSRGIGAALLECAQKHAAERGYPYIYLHVEAGNIRARRFYLAHGFEDDEVQGHRIRMKKTI